MKNRWSDQEAAAFAELYSAHGEALALRAYTARLLGTEPSLVLHGGGNTSVKARAWSLFGEEVEALHVKASGLDLAAIAPGGHPACDLALLRRLRELPPVDDDRLAALLRASLLDPRASTPSIEAPVHALLPARFVDHTHADAVLALTNRPGGEAVARAALGGEVIVLPYVTPGIELAQATVAALQAQPEAIGMVWAKHGLLTWGETARQSYERTIELVDRAERFLAAARGGRRTSAAAQPGPQGPPAAGMSSRPAEAPAEAEASSSEPRVTVEELAAAERVVALRGALVSQRGDPDRLDHRLILAGLTDRETLAALAGPGARELLVTPPLTADHVIRVGRLPLWVEPGADEDGERVRTHLSEAIARHVAAERALLEQHAPGVAASVLDAELLPRVALLPGLGAFCAGRTAREAEIALDITAHTLAVKATIAAAGAAYQGLEDEHLLVMQHRGMQQAKLGRGALTPRGAPLAGSIALVTGAAGAIGSGVSRVLLEAGACVALTDLPRSSSGGEALDSLAAELAAEFPRQVLATPVDVTDRQSVAAGFAAAIRAWGGVDLVVANAGAAHVATLEELDTDAFRRLERVNVEGTLHVLAEAARHFRRQAIGGDVVLISTKNVFAPGAGFGAYSATKAAAHQLARIASLELAEIGVRVNMVAPDAVFGDGDRKSGLWAEVGPARMRARGLDEAGLADYYRDRNLLKARITARHVGQAVLFFATRQTPTTGATMPVDGGLPEATPR